MRHTLVRLTVLVALLTLGLLASSTERHTALALPPPGHIDHFAGGSSGNGTPALTMGLGPPSAIAGDPAGDLYVATERCAIYRITAGVVSKVAGTGPQFPTGCGYTGDGGPAVAAQINAVPSIVVAPNNDLYIADGCRVRRISAGMITTFAGNGSCSFNGDGISAMSAGIRPTGLALEADGDLLIADELNCRLRQISGGIITTIGGVGGAGGCLLPG